MKVLDHGYVNLIEHWGADSRIIEAARMSTNKGFNGWGPVKKCKKCNYTVGTHGSGAARVLLVADRGAHCHALGQSHDFGKEKAGDERLLKYLYEHKHSTPFEMAGLIIEVKAPIFVFRQWHRHRTFSYNEMSARYTPLPDDNYVPDVSRCLVVQSKNKQANSANDKELTHEMVLGWLEKLEELYKHSQQVYDDGLAIGIPKELARLPVTVGRYSVMRASTNLRNWLAFLTLRMDSHAQWEIQVFAEAVYELLCEKFPKTMELFDAGRLGIK